MKNQFNVRLSDETISKINRICEENNISQAECIERLVDVARCAHFAQIRDPENQFSADFNFFFNN